MISDVTEGKRKKEKGKRKKKRSKKTKMKKTKTKKTKVKKRYLKKKVRRVAHFDRYTVTMAETYSRCEEL